MTTYWVTWIVGHFTYVSNLNCKLIQMQAITKAKMTKCLNLTTKAKSFNENGIVSV